MERCDSVINLMEQEDVVLEVNDHAKSLDYDCNMEKRETDPRVILNNYLPGTLIL